MSAKNYQNSVKTCLFWDPFYISETNGGHHQDHVVMNDRCVILPWPRRVDASQ